MGTGCFYCLEEDGEGRLVVEPLSRFTNWRGSWAQIVPGRFSAAAEGRCDDVLFYDRSASDIEIYSMDGAGRFADMIARHRTRRSWDVILPGRWGGPSDYTDLLCYDRRSGTLEFYACHADASLELLRRFENQRTSWDVILAGLFERYSFGDRWQDLMLYDRAAGHGEFRVVRHAPDGLVLEHRAGYDNWRRSWSIIVPGVFSYADEISDLVTDLLFYDREAAEAEFYGLSVNDDGSLRWELLLHQGGWRSSWDVILPGHFWAASSPGGTDLLLYERSSGDLEFHDTAPTRTDDLRRRWTLRWRWEPGLDAIVTGRWVPADQPGGRRTGFLTYRR